MVRHDASENEVRRDILGMGRPTSISIGRSGKIRTSDCRAYTRRMALERMAQRERSECEMGGLSSNAVVGWYNRSHFNNGPAIRERGRARSGSTVGEMNTWNSVGVCSTGNGGIKDEGWYSRLRPRPRLSSTSGRGMVRGRGASGGLENAEEKEDEEVDDRVGHGRCGGCHTGERIEVSSGT